MGCAVIGGFVYRGTLYPGIQGIYFYGDFCSGRIWGLRFDGTNWETAVLLKSSLQISTFGEDQEGNIIVADYATGDVYRVTAQ